MPYSDPKKAAQYQADYRKTRRDSGICLYPGCDLSAAGGKRMCRPHLAMQAKSVRAVQLTRESVGLCGRCGDPCGADTKACERCLARRRDERVKLLTEGLCTICGATATAREFCEEHWFGRLCIAHKLGGKKSIQMLRRIWAQQDGKCALTGAALVPGDNASLDHIIPSSRGGKSVESNLQWVTRAANTMKRDMSVADFVATARAVVAHADAQQVHEEEELH